MVQNNKVLTVSYGTFSCTLEGFEDSFDTMKAIAEYFRDLAADDRYFGAEPPQPDADMLARIAQREISRQVEARTDSKGIVLRAADAAPAVAPAAAPAASVEPAEVVDVAEVVEPTDTPAPEAVVEPAPSEDVAAKDATPDESQAAVADVAEDPVEETAEAVPAQEVAQTEDTAPATEEAMATPEADEAELEAAAGQDAADEPVAESQPETDDADIETIAEMPAQEDTPKVELAEDAPVVAEEASEASLDADDVDSDEDAALAAIAARVADTEEEVPTLEAEPVEKDDIVPAADSIAAKLQRIRAVVSRNEQAAQSETYDEDEHAEEVVTATSAGLTDALQVEDETVEDSTDEVAVIMNTLEAEDATDEDEAPQEDALFSDLDEADAEESDDEDELSNILGSDEPTEPSTQPKTRVLKVKRQDLDAAMAAGDLRIAEQDELDQDDVPAGSSLLPEDEADLMRELAAVEAELSADADDEVSDFENEVASVTQIDTQADDETSDEGIEQAEVAADDMSERDEPLTLEADEDDLSRLMATADEKLDDPDTSSSREAYTHLRAAVAAAHAERSAGGTVGTHTSDDDYRDDLASVVRPRRPTAKVSSPRPRADAERPAPLKLVAEQRIDVPTETQNRGPVRPRRVATVEVEDSASENTQGFAEFASEQGAVTLPDLLEAAAAYMSFVEGREQFSRPQLMNKVRQLDNQSFNREDGLRSFGQLLRDGKIEKAGGGRFVASGDIGFHPGKRAAG